MSAISCSLESLHTEAVSQFLLRTTKNDDTDRGGRHVIIALANTVRGKPKILYEKDN